MSQYLHYTFAENSSTITNHGTGGSGYNGQATRNQYAKNSLGNPMWGPLTDNYDAIQVPGGISNPYQHTWEFGINIQKFWPINGVQNCILVGNDGKFWSGGNDLFYGYAHGECSWNGIVAED